MNYESNESQEDKIKRLLHYKLAVHRLCTNCTHSSLSKFDGRICYILQAMDKTNSLVFTVEDDHVCRKHEF